MLAVIDGQHVSALCTARTPDGLQIIRTWLSQRIRQDTSPDIVYLVEGLQPVDLRKAAGHIIANREEQLKGWRALWQAHKQRLKTWNEGHGKRLSPSQLLHSCPPVLQSRATLLHSCPALPATVLLSSSGGLAFLPSSPASLRPQSSSTCVFDAGLCSCIEIGCGNIAPVIHHHVCTASDPIQFDQILQHA